MSKQVDIQITCPNCGQVYTNNFFRTISGEHESNRNIVIEDRINIAKCPLCNHSFHLPLAMMYVDVKKGFAVWWEPNHDEGVDSDAAGYVKIFGCNSYYAQAPRIADWNKFKETINQYYDGTLVGGEVEKMDLSALKNDKKSNKSGCLGVCIFATALISILVAI